MNMAVVKRFVIKLKRKAAGWDLRYLQSIVGLSAR
jgi:hypothetical protein